MNSFLPFGIAFLVHLLIIVLSKTLKFLPISPRSFSKNSFFFKYFSVFIIFAVALVISSLASFIIILSITDKYSNVRMADLVVRQANFYASEAKSGLKEGRPTTGETSAARFIGASIYDANAYFEAAITTLAGHKEDSSILRQLTPAQLALAFVHQGWTYAGSVRQSVIEIQKANARENLNAIFK